MSQYDSLDSDLKAWACWVHAQRDKSVGWPGHSPITKFGQPSGKGYGTDYRVWDHTGADCARIDTAIRTLRSMSVRVLMIYYVQCHARVTIAARLLHIHPTQLRRDLVRIMSELTHAMAAQNESEIVVANRNKV